MGRVLFYEDLHQTTEYQPIQILTTIILNENTIF